MESRKFIPLMYQLAARLGTKHEDELFQTVLSKVYTKFRLRDGSSRIWWYGREGGCAWPALLPNIIGYSVMHSTLLVIHLSAVSDNCGNLMILRKTTWPSGKHFYTTYLVLGFSLLSVVAKTDLFYKFYENCRIF